MGIRLPHAFLPGLACAFFVQSEDVRATSSQRIELVRADEMDWAEGRRAVEDELSASGYRVEHTSSDALDVGVLLDELAAGSSPEAAARVTVLRLGRTGIAYVWLLESGRTYRVTSGEPDPVRAANVLSLRVVELIDLRAEGVEEELVEPSRRDERAPPSHGEHRDPDRAEAWLLLAGGGLTWGDGVASPLGSLELFLGRRIAQMFGVGATFSLGLNRSFRDYDDRTLGAMRQRGAIGPFLWSRESPFWQVGADTGLECYQFSWESQVGDGKSSACAPSSSLFARAGVRWGDATVWGAGSASLAHRRIRLLESDEVVARYGQPEATFSGGVGWTF